jgi:hypothetical protein
MALCAQNGRERRNAERGRRRRSRRRRDLAGPGSATCVPAERLYGARRLSSALPRLTSRPSECSLGPSLPQRFLVTPAASKPVHLGQGQRWRQDSEVQPPYAIRFHDSLATLVLLVAVSAAAATRSVVLRRRYRACIAAAIANGTFDASMLRPGLDRRDRRWGDWVGGGGGLVADKPRFVEVWVDEKGLLRVPSGTGR